MTRVLELDGLDALIGALSSRGYDVVGPTVRDGAIVYDEIESASDLPAGWTDVQDGGTYRLRAPRGRRALRLRGRPDLVEALLFPPRLLLWRARQASPEADLEVEEEPLPPRPLAFIGVRACELAAIAIQDRVFVGGRYVDRDYAARREDVLLVAVNCHEPGGTCFCVSMDTGPHGATLRLRPRADRAAGRRPPLPGRGRERARRRGPRRAWRRRGDRGGRARAGGVGGGRSRPDGTVARHPRHPRPARSTTSSTRAGTRSPSAASRAATARWPARPASAPPSRTRTT